MFQHHFYNFTKIFFALIPKYRFWFLNMFCFLCLWISICVISVYCVAYIAIWNSVIIEWSNNVSNNVTRGKWIELESPCISLCYWFNRNLINCTTFHSDHKCYFILLRRETVLWKLVQIIFRKDTVIVKYVLARS